MILISLGSLIQINTNVISQSDILRMFENMFKNV